MEGLKLVFKTNSEVKLYQDVDHSFISTNPAEVLASIFEDLKSEDFVAKLNAQLLLLKIAEQGGIYYNPEEGPKKVLSDKRLVFFASDSKENNLFGYGSASKFDAEAYKRLKYFPTLLHVML